MKTTWTKAFSSLCVLGALLLTGCKSTEQPSETVMANDQLAGSQWQLVTLHSDESIALPEAKPMLMFQSKDQVAGYDGCNRFRGPVKLKEDVLIFGMLASTKRFCHDVENADMAFMAMLVEVRFAKATSTTLTLLDKSKQPLATFKQDTKTPAQ